MIYSIFHLDMHLYSSNNNFLLCSISTPSFSASECPRETPVALELAIMPNSSCFGISIFQLSHQGSLTGECIFSSNMMPLYVDFTISMKRLILELLFGRVLSKKDVNSEAS